MSPRPLLAALLILPGLGACAPRDPLGYIPASDRSMMQAEARLAEARAGGGIRPGGAGRVGVADMLARAREATPAQGGAAAAGLRGAVLLRYPAGAVQPDASQYANLERFATEAQGARRILILAQGGGFPGVGTAGGEPLLGQRRAVAVARFLQSRFPEVEVRFERSAAADEVAVLADPPASALENPR